MNKLLTFFTAALLSLSAWAASLPPDQAVASTADELQDLIIANTAAYKADQTAFYKVVDRILIPRFDVKYIAQMSLGKNWKTASEAQRNRFIEACKLGLVRAYADAMLQYASQVKAEWQPAKFAANADDVTVRATLKRKDSPQPVKLAFLTHKMDDGEWRIYDISIENISLVTNFRAQLNVDIKKSGLDTVISQMESGEYFRKNQAAKK
jgi:phospholipid transport system substrate-binding protein